MIQYNGEITVSIESEEYKKFIIAFQNGTSIDIEINKHFVPIKVIDMRNTNIGPNLYCIFTILSI